MMVIDDALDFLIFFCCRKRLLFLTLSHGEDIITIITRVIISTWSVTTTYILFEKKKVYIVLKKPNLIVFLLLPNYVHSL